MLHTKANTTLVVNDFGSSNVVGGRKGFTLASFRIAISPRRPCTRARILTHIPSHSSKRTHSYQVRNECAPPTTPAQHFEPPFCRPVYLILLLSFTRSIHPFSLVLSAHLDSHVAHASRAHLPLASIIRNSSRICGDGTGPAYSAQTFTCVVIFALCSMLVAIKMILFSVFCACRSRRTVHPLTQGLFHHHYFHLYSSVSL